MWHWPETNDIVPVGLDREVETKGETFFAALAEKRPRDPSRRPPPGPPVIGPEQTAVLSDIKVILAADGADVRLVTSPLHDRVPLNAADAAELRKIFGVSRVYDFSGSTALTDDVHNFYEQSHYRPHVARRILQIAYAGGLQ